LAGFFCQCADADLLWVRAGRARRDGQQSRRDRCRPDPRAIPADREFPRRRHLRLGRGVRRLHHCPARVPGRARRRLGTAPRMTEASTAQNGPARTTMWGAAPIGHVLPFLILLAVGLTLPLFARGFGGVLATRACVYWVLVAGLNLLVGFAGQLAIGWVALLTLGAYTTSVLAAGNVLPPLDPYLALAIAAVIGA